MKSFTIIAAFVVTASAQYLNGFNIGATEPNGTCRTQAQWETAFQQIQALPGGFNTARLYASAYCDTLANAVPAAIATNTSLFVGVWPEDSNLDAEKAAIESAITTYGDDYLIAISVGSEDLYRNETTAEELAGQIYEIKSLMANLSSEVPVGHAEQWGAW